jgi:hypothetical protein
MNGALPAWNVAQFGCLTRENTNIESTMRTQVTASLPLPWVSRKGDTSAPLQLSFGIDVTDAGWRAWQQWVTFDLADGVLSFTIYLPWGTANPRVRARLMGEWRAERQDAARWQISGTMELERWTLPRFSGGANA